jgi:hypothetical protein
LILKLIFLCKVDFAVLERAVIRILNEHFQLVQFPWQKFSYEKVVFKEKISIYNKITQISRLQISIKFSS